MYIYSYLLKVHIMYILYRYKAATSNFPLPWPSIGT